ncbi:MAG: ATP--guanido phosphotransferase, partial [Limnochordia bacterium]
ELANRVDNLIEANVDYAFDPDIGYLTACPTNVGTGMRGSVMLHLPALARINQLENVLRSVSQFGLAVRGLYGEGSESYGSIYQISNQISLGHSETEMLEHLSRVAHQVISSERQARQYLQEQNRDENEDQIHRAYGLLTHARIISSREAMDLLSTVMLGIDLGILRDLDRGLVKKLMVEIRAAHLQKMMGQSLPAQERDRLRASLIRDRLSRQI